MSRIGSKPVVIPSGVTCTFAAGVVTVTGPKGTLKLPVRDEIELQGVGTATIRVVPKQDGASIAALHGLTRSLFANMVEGVRSPWEKKLEIIGVGFQATLSGSKLTLQVGYANPVVIQIPPGVTAELPDSTHITVRSADRQLVGQVAADIRRVRPPEPYKGKGIRYVGEHVRRKSGKAFGS